MSTKDDLIRLYDETVDPWSLESSWYERRKYALTLASLPRERYRSAYEPGCSIGVLTALLASRCDSLLASDFVPRALEAATARLSVLPHVRVAAYECPTEWPDGRFDLIVLSEILYFLRPLQVDELARRVDASLEAGGTVIAVHWTGSIDEWALPAAEAHERIRARARLRPVVRHDDATFLLEVFER